MACRIQPITAPLTPRDAQAFYDETRNKIEAVEGASASKLEADTSYTLTGVVVPGDSGALKVGDLIWNENDGSVTSGSGLAMTPFGILGAKNGSATFVVTNNGDATFAGELNAATGTFSGTVMASRFLTVDDDEERIDINNNSDNKARFFGDRGDGTIDELVVIGVTSNDFGGFFQTYNASFGKLTQGYNNLGLMAASYSSVGVHGRSQSDYGVYGGSASSSGVRGESSNDVGVSAFSSSTTTGSFQLHPKNDDDLPTAGEKGMFVTLNNGKLYYHDGSEWLPYDLSTPFAVIYAKTDGFRDGVIGDVNSGSGVYGRSKSGLGLEASTASTSSGSLRLHAKDDNTDPTYPQMGEFVVLNNGTLRYYNGTSWVTLAT